MRRSELFGLEFKHFDYEQQLLHLRQAPTYSKEINRLGKGML